jgi:phosphatidyl-myo-inositol dimannoside synthase
MRVLLTSEARFERTPEGAIWGAPAYGRDLWTRYLEVFSNVLVAARVAEVTEPSDGLVRASRPQVSFCPLPPYSGLSGLVRHLPALRGRLADAVRGTGAIIVRAPSPLAYMTCQAATRLDRPFAAEIVGDPDQVFSPGAFHHPLRGSIRRLATAAQRRIARDASAVLYVTREELQRRYPTCARAFAASDAALDDLAFSGGGARAWNGQTPFVLVSVGGLDQPFKGTSVLLQAVSQLVRHTDTPVTLRIVGGGRLLAAFQAEADALGLGARVQFLGQQHRAGVREALDSADLFVLPSFTEGLPRALLEAMARGLPAVATQVGGVPELLPEQCLVPAGNPAALASRLGQMIADDRGRRRLGERNRERALTYHERLQAPVRRAFLRAVSQSNAHAVREAYCA